VIYERSQGKYLKKGGLYLSYTDLLFLLSEPTFHEFAKELWSYEPLNAEYSTRLCSILSVGETSPVSLVVQTDDEEEDYDENKENKKEKKKLKV